MEILQIFFSILTVLVCCLRCRNTQGVYDKCVFDNMGIERPEYGYFCRAKVGVVFRFSLLKNRLIVTFL